MAIRFFNTLTRKLDEFTPLEENHVRMYTCGPTVYDFAHIGNFRAYMFEDLLRRHLKFSGYRVTQVMNLTDIDDKTIRGSQAKGIPLKEYTKTYIDAFFQDLKKLNIEPVEHYPAATDHVPEMLELIQRLFDNGYAYRSDDGSVYFKLCEFENYGRLAHLDMSGLKAGARVVQDEYDKDNVADFALWKAWNEADGDVVWDSPWGRGRPGWHIECSAMSMKYLGESFDIHTGGIDNMFPHHENEIAQAEAATGKPFVMVWMHCAHLRVEGQKMAKSLGNFYTLDEILGKGYSGREVRYVLLSGHYRQPLNFTFDALLAARSALSRLDEFQQRLRECAGDAGAGDVPEWVTRAREAFTDAMENDLNVPEALAAIFDMVHEGNRCMDTGSVEPTAAAAALAVLQDLDRVLGMLSSLSETPGEDVERLLEARQDARANRNWAESDRIRDELAAMGWEVRDTPDGQKVKQR